MFYDTLTGNPTLRDQFQEGDGLGPEMVVLQVGTFQMGCLSEMISVTRTSIRRTRSQSSPSPSDATR